jgi:hypothetical protein
MKKQCIYPITFSIPSTKITNQSLCKVKIMSSLIPGKLDTYIYTNETDYYNEYKSSMFALTSKKAGWDCMRHYEILANGCIPYFPEILNCPKNTMALFPKDLIIKGNFLYQRLCSKTIDSLLQEEKDECLSLSQSLLEYTRNTLTTVKMAQYILDKVNVLNVSNILYLSGDTGPDYLRCLTLHGFKQLYGKNCHDYPKIPHIYKSKDINYSSLYGKGITYTNLLEDELHNSDSNNTIIDDIKSKKYDIIIYGSYHRGMPLFDLVTQTYEPNKIVLLCGEDIHHCNYLEFANKGYITFIRELDT